MQDQQRRKTEAIEVDFVNHERLYLAQVVVNCVKRSLEVKNDSYMQFHSLILMDYLFQQMLPVPTYQNEVLKSKLERQGRGQEQGKDIQDIETLEITEDTPEVSAKVLTLSF